MHDDDDDDDDLNKVRIYSSLYVGKYISESKIFWKIWLESPKRF
jgi:hypothetical protein